jgi:hypothetical protein
MTPQEKAKDLIRQFYSVGAMECKQCALVAVNEILSMGIMSHSGDWQMAKSYWEEVKQEIKKLY